MREKALNGANAFFDQLFDARFNIPTEGVVRQPVETPVDFSSDEDEKPVRMRIMEMRKDFVFEVKPKKRKAAPIVATAEHLDTIPPPVQIKPILKSHGSQCTRHTQDQETQSALRSSRVDQATVALSESETQTKSLKRRHEASNTDSILPSCENVCIAFLENLLNDSPVFINQGPNSEQIEGIILAFLDELLRDARGYDPGHTESYASPRENEPPTFIPAKRLKVKTVSAEVQHDIPKQAISTQSYVCLKSLHIMRDYIYIPMPELERVELRIQPKGMVSFEIMPDRRPLELGDRREFMFVPPLKTTREICRSDEWDLSLPHESVRRDDRSTNTEAKRNSLVWSGPLKIYFCKTGGVGPPIPISIMVTSADLNKTLGNTSLSLQYQEETTSEIRITIQKFINPIQPENHHHSSRSQKNITKYLFITAI
jgi:hypothetical protein